MIELIANEASSFDFVLGKIGKIHSWMTPAKSISAWLDGRLLGAVVYDGFTPYDCNIHLAVEDSRCVTRHVLWSVFQYPFVQLGLDRVTALIAASNDASVDFCERIDFTFEGFKRRALAGEDELIYGMLKTECRWIR